MQLKQRLLYSPETGKNGMNIQLKTKSPCIWSSQMRTRWLTNFKLFNKVTSKSLFFINNNFDKEAEMDPKSE
jgi:hypothetical protein